MITCLGITSAFSGKGMRVRQGQGHDLIVDDCRKGSRTGTSDSRLDSVCLDCCVYLQGTGVSTNRALRCRQDVTRPKGTSALLTAE